jgi:hypothetical protein
MKNKSNSLQLLLITIKALDLDTEQAIIDKLVQFPELKLLYTLIFFNYKKSRKKTLLNLQTKQLLLILKKNCDNEIIRNRLQGYKRILNSSKVLKNPTSNSVDYYSLVQYVKRFTYYHSKLNESPYEIDPKLIALKGLIILERIIEL